MATTVMRAVGRKVDGEFLGKIPIFGGLGWWYFREQSFPDYGPAYREYAYVTNGKSNTVSVIDLRTFALFKTINVGSEPSGIAANSKKNEIYVVNAGSNNISVIDTETNAVAATRKTNATSLRGSSDV